MNTLVTWFFLILTFCLWFYFDPDSSYLYFLIILLYMLLNRLLFILCKQGELKKKERKKSYRNSIIMHYGSWSLKWNLRLFYFLEVLIWVENYQKKFVLVYQYLGVCPSTHFFSRSVINKRENRLFIPYVMCFFALQKIGI